LMVLRKNLVHLAFKTVFSYLIEQGVLIDASFGALFYHLLGRSC
jgi:hypothetical protein